jgi:hypothetical protein
MQFFSLIPHPTAAKAPAIDVYAVALILGNGRVSFGYRARGEVQHISLPAKGKPTRTDDLWRHTCFEAFVATRNSERYSELNFSPSSAWAAYSFESYRYGMQSLPVIKTPVIQVKLEPDLLAVDVTVQIRSLAADSIVGLTAVIENVDGGVSHWALAHSGAKADFHDAKTWTAMFQRQSLEYRA